MLSLCSDFTGTFTPLSQKTPSAQLKRSTFIFYQNRKQNTRDKMIPLLKIMPGHRAVSGRKHSYDYTISKRQLMCRRLPLPNFMLLPLLAKTSVLSMYDKKFYVCFCNPEKMNLLHQTNKMTVTVMPTEKKIFIQSSVTPYNAGVNKPIITHCNT